MKLNSSLIIAFISFFFISSVSATVLNGRVNIMVNDGSNFKVVLQINTDTEAQKMGGATFIINYDSSLLNYPDNPENGTDYIFSNFNLGYYDTAKVTKISSGRLWLNIDLSSDGHGTTVQKGPEAWTDLVVLNFESSRIVQNNAIYWGVNNRFWGVYDSDNSTTWDKGNFDLVTTVESNNNKNENFDYSLSQNYPNPFNPTTVIQYYVPSTSLVNLIVFNTIGEKIALLINEEKPAGKYEVTFDASKLPSGIYFYRIQAGSFIDTRKMILLK